MLKTSPNLTLASRSSARSALLSAAGLRFNSHAADIDENALKDELLLRGHNAKSIALNLAQAKALKVSAQTSDLVIGADQTLQLGEDLISKTESLLQAKALFHRFSGRSHYLHSGICLAQNNAVIWSKVDTAEMQVRDLKADFIDEYFAHVGPQVLNAVGAYHLEGLGVQIFDAIKGDYFTVLGLPLLPLLHQLRQMQVIG
jgi:septum formation protein